MRGLIIIGILCAWGNVYAGQFEFEQGLLRASQAYNAMAYRDEFSGNPYYTKRAHKYLAELKRNYGKIYKAITGWEGTIKGFVPSGCDDNGENCRGLNIVVKDSVVEYILPYSVYGLPKDLDSMAVGDLVVFGGILTSPDFPIMVVLTPYIKVK